MESHHGGSMIPLMQSAARHFATRGQVLDDQFQISSLIGTHLD
jgi:hypothetical protein